MIELIFRCADYWCIISRVSKSEAINLMQKIGMIEKLRNIVNHKNKLMHIKIVNEIWWYWNWKKINLTAIKVLFFRKCRYWKCSSI